MLNSITSISGWRRQFRSEIRLMIVSELGGQVKRLALIPIERKREGRWREGEEEEGEGGRGGGRRGEEEGRGREEVSLQPTLLSIQISLTT